MSAVNFRMAVSDIWVMPTVTSTEFSLHHSQRQFLKYGGPYSFIGFTDFKLQPVDALVIGKLFERRRLRLFNRALACPPAGAARQILSLKRCFRIMSSVGGGREKRVRLAAKRLLVGGYAFAVSIGINIAARYC